jgi:archaellum component FlaC
VKNSGKGERGLKFEREKLVLKYKKMEQDIATLENNMGFFARSKNADSMIADIQKKIALAKEELARIEEKIKIIDNQFE